MLHNYGNTDCRVFKRRNAKLEKFPDQNQHIYPKVIVEFGELD